MERQTPIRHGVKVIYVSLMLRLMLRAKVIDGFLMLRVKVIDGSLMLLIKACVGPSALNTTLTLLLICLLESRVSCGGCSKGSSAVI